MCSVLCVKLDEALPDENSDYSIGYFEGRHQTKCWIVSTEDLEVMYQLHKGESFRWCNGREEAVDKHSDEAMAKRKSCKSESAVRERQDREDLESIYSQLQKKHGDSYSGPQLHLWARMIVLVTHDDKEEAP